MNRELPIGRVVSSLAAWTCILAGLGALAGCDRQAGDDLIVEHTSTTEPATTEPAANEPTANRSPQAADAQDHAEAPRALPRTGEVQGWIKVRPVQVAAGTDASGFPDDPALRQVLDEFRFHRLARTSYRSPRANAEVLVAEASSTEDAVGAFSVLEPAAPCLPREDGSMRASRLDGTTLVLTACQGDVLLRFVCTLSEDAGRRDCEALLSRTVFGLPMTEPPLLMRAVRDVQQTGCELWIVRSAATLQKQPNRRLELIDPPVLEAQLGLDGNVLLSVTAVEQTQGAVPIIIWLARYPSTDAATAAAERYTRALADPIGLDAVTFLGAPKGVFLIGTWSEQAVARDLVKLLEEVLPEQE